VVECATAADLDEALRRGLIDVKLTDRLGLVRDEERLDYRQIRLLARRDFLDPPERCIRVSEDGLELHVDAARSDLLLEVELRRFAEPVESAAGGPHYRFARPLLRQALAQGWTIGDLDRWLMQRAGQPLSPAARLLALPEESASLRLRSCLVLHVPDELTADGLLQWPATRGLIRERLGPTALVVAAEDVPRLQQRLAELGQSLAVDTDPASMAPPSDQAARASSDTKRV
ncbi:MAG: helicase-associated domain-containing protein, partial [Gemmataceae bacterium]|nr:helicase-associated domain-containing protein [Gemmataceae bacterium]